MSRLAKPSPDIDRLEWRWRIFPCQNIRAGEIMRKSTWKAAWARICTPGFREESNQWNWAGVEWSGRDQMLQGSGVAEGFVGTNESWATLNLTDTIMCGRGPLMRYLPLRWPRDPVSTSHLQCGTISARLKRHCLESIDYKLLLENGRDLNKGHVPPPPPPPPPPHHKVFRWPPAFFNNLYV